MLLARLLNACHHFPGFVYAAVRLIEATRTIEVDVRARRGSKARCSCCGNKAAGYDVLPTRRFEFIPIWGYAVMLRYAMRRVQCTNCGVKVESVPWAIGKHSLTQAYMLYLAHWARKLSWKETATSFGTTWEQVCHAVEYVVQWGLENRELGTLRAIGVDEIHIGQSHKFLTLVYQIQADCTPWPSAGTGHQRKSGDGPRTTATAALPPPKSPARWVVGERTPTTAVPPASSSGPPATVGRGRALADLISSP